MKEFDYSVYLAEYITNSIQYSKFISENISSGIEYSKYLTNTIDKSINYSEYLAETMGTMGKSKIQILRDERIAKLNKINNAHTNNS